MEIRTTLICQGNLPTQPRSWSLGKLKETKADGCAPKLKIIAYRAEQRPIQRWNRKLQVGFDDRKHRKQNIFHGLTKKTHIS